MTFTRMVPSVLLSVVLVGSLGACSGGDTVDAIVRAVEQGDGDAVDFEMVLGGQWDHFLVICPYDGDVNESLGFEWADAPEPAYEEGSQEIVFVRDNEVVGSSRFGFGEVNFCRSGGWPLMAKGDTVTFDQLDSGVWQAVR